MRTCKSSRGGSWIEMMRLASFIVFSIWGFPKIGDPNIVHSGHSIMKLAWCPESGPANWAENLNKKLLNGQRCLCPAPPK